MRDKEEGWRIKRKGGWVEDQRKRKREGGERGVGSSSLHLSKSRDEINSPSGFSSF